MLDWVYARSGVCLIGEGGVMLVPNKQNANGGHDKLIKIIIISFLIYKLSHEQPD